MECTPATVDVPIQVPHRHGRLILLLAGAVLLIAGLWWWLFPSLHGTIAPSNNLFSVWFSAISAATYAGLLLFAVVTALLDLRPRIRWLVVYAVLLTEGLLLHVGDLSARR